MKFFFKSKMLSAAVLATLTLSGCGDASDIDQVSGQDVVPTQSVALSRYSGRVLDSAGNPRPGVVVSLENRLTNEMVKVASSFDGGFETFVRPGIYDAFVDDETTDTGVAVVGPLDLTRDSRRDLNAPVGLTPGLFRGRILLADGRPASSRGVVLLPATSFSGDPNVPAEVPDPVQTVTDSEGNFSIDWPYLTQRLGQGRQQRLGVGIVILEAGETLPAPDFFDDGNDSNPATEDEYLLPSDEQIAEWYNAIEEVVDVELQDSRATAELFTGSGTVNRQAGDADGIPGGAAGDILAQAAGSFEPFRAIDILDRSAAAYTFGFGTKFISEARFRDGVIRPYNPDQQYATKPLRDYLDNFGALSGSEWEEMRDRVFHRDGGVAFAYRLGLSAKFVNRNTDMLDFNESIRLPYAQITNVRTAASFKFKTRDGNSAEVRVYGASLVQDYNLFLGSIDLTRGSIESKDIVELEISLNRF